MHQKPIEKYEGLGAPHPELPLTLNSKPAELPRAPLTIYMGARGSDQIPGRASQNVEGG